MAEDEKKTELHFVNKPVYHLLVNNNRGKEGRGLKEREGLNA